MAGGVAHRIGLTLAVLAPAVVLSALGYETIGHRHPRQMPARLPAETGRDQAV